METSLKGHPGLGTLYIKLRFTIPASLKENKILDVLLALSVNLQHAYGYMGIFLL